MSMHKIPLTPLEEEGLRLHGLPIGTPSQRSDTFRQGVAWAIGEAKRLTEENERLKRIGDNYYTLLVDANLENERLRADAERYRWLSDDGGIHSLPYDEYGCGPVFDLSRETIDATRENTK